MKKSLNKLIFTVPFVFLASVLVAVLISLPAMSGEYPALKGLKGVKTVFDVSLGSPQRANVVFWAVRNVYNDAGVRALAEPPQVVVVFHGPAVKLLTTDREGFEEGDNEALDTFARTLKDMKREGGKLEVCGYAMKVLGVDPETVFPEVDQVGNGFISIAGYQNQGYSAITIN